MSLGSLLQCLAVARTYRMEALAEAYASIVAKKHLGSGSGGAGMEPLLKVGSCALCFFRICSLCAGGCALCADVLCLMCCRYLPPRLWTLMMGCSIHSTLAKTQTSMLILQHPVSGQHVRVCCWDVCDIRCLN